MRRRDLFVLRRTGAAFCCAVFLVAATALKLRAQSQNPSSAANPYFGSITVEPVTNETVKMSLDEAIRRGIDKNLGLKEAEHNEKALHGEYDEAVQEFLPTISVSGGTGVFQHNLAALGFGPSTLKKFSAAFPAGQAPARFSTITKDDLTQGQINFSEILFSGPVIAGWRAAGAATRAAHFQKMSARGEVVQQVATAYLQAVAAASEVDDATALEKADQVLFEQAHAAHQAGTAANLDELRARVQLQAQQQQVIAAQNALDKDLILLKREIGIDPGQNIVLTDPAPYSELAAQTPEEVRAIAYKNRQDYQTLQNQVVEMKAVHAAYRSQRLPTLTFGGFYGVDKVNGTGSHGDFAAVGTLSFPIFREAKLRGDEEAARAQLNSVEAQLDDVEAHIDQQVRAALLDVDATAKQVEVARSNLALATRALSDETDRFNAGIDDTLPLVTAQATLASAQTNLVESRYQYNLAKLGLARASGVIETQYRAYLGH